MTDPIAPSDVAGAIKPAPSRRRGVNHESLVDRFHGSELTQKPFREGEDISYHGF